MVENQNLRITPAKLMIVLAGDLLAFLMFTLIGKLSHKHDISLMGLVQTMLPIFIAWIVTGCITHVFSEKAIGNVKTAAINVITTWFLACPFALVLREIIYQETIILSFFITTFIFNTILLLIWRIILTWFIHRKS